MNHFTAIREIHTGKNSQCNNDQKHVSASFVIHPFDNKTTRTQQRGTDKFGTDKFAAIRES